MTSDLTPRERLAALVDAINLASDAVDHAIDIDAPLPDIDLWLGCWHWHSAQLPAARAAVRRAEPP